MKVSLLGIRIAGALLALSLVGTMKAAPTLTTIDDVLYKADGSLFEGVLMINWRSFEGPGQTHVPTNSVTVSVTDGRIYTRLIPTTTAPQAAYYSVRYVAAGSVQFTELWSVPVSDSALQVRDVRIEWPPATSAISAPVTDLAIADVEGLSEALDVRPLKGPAYGPSRAAVIGSAGDIEAAAGSADDCLRVDGTAGPCGIADVAGFRDAESPLGTIDGVNQVFTLSLAPAPPESLLLYRNGILQKTGQDYTLSGNIIDFYAASTPEQGDHIIASYRINEELTVTYGFVDAETPLGTIDGSNATFTLSEAPNPSASLLLHHNGVRMTQGFDYTLANNEVTFVSGAIPTPGDTLIASFRTVGN